MDEEDEGIVRIVLHLDAEIIMSDGNIKKSIDIEENDILLGSSNLNIVFKKKMSETNLYRVIPRYGNSFVVSDHSQFLIFNNITSQYDLMDINLFNTLNNEQKQYLSINKSSIDYFEKNVNIDPYFVGLFIGNDNENFININLNDDYISKKNRLKESTNKLKLRYFTDDLTKTITILKMFFDEQISEEYYDFLVEKNIPEIYMKNSINIRRQLLAGIIDINSDKHSNYIEINNLTRKMANLIYNLCFSIGLYHIHLIIKGKSCSIKIFDDLDEIPLLIKKDYYLSSSSKNIFLYNNFKIAPIVEKKCVVLIFKELSNIILSDFTMI